MQIDIVVFDGVDELDAIGPFEVLRNAAKLGAGFSVRLVSWTGGPQVIGAHGLCVTIEVQDLGDARPDLVIIPGGGWNDRNPQGARAEAERGIIPARLAELHQVGTTVAAVCTGAMIVASAGLLQGRAATTHHAAVDDLRRTGANVIAARVVDDGDIITCGGVTSGLDLALWLVERFASPGIANRVAAEMEYERRGDVWQRPNA